MEMAELKKLTEDKRQAVHPRLSQCQLGRDSEYVRKNASRGGNKVTLPRDVLEPLPSAGVSFCLALSTDQVAPCLQPRASKCLKSATASASRHKKTRCDAHIGPGDGGTDNMAQLLATA